MTTTRQKTIAVLSTLDTKGAETAFLRDEITRLGCKAHLIDIGVVGEPQIPADTGAAEVAELGRTPLSDLRRNPSRDVASDVMVAGATSLMNGLIQAGKADAVISLGGTQGTANATKVMQALPYGFPKVMVSTMASGDTAGYVGIKDITMMFSVCDILGLNPLFRSILSNAAGAVTGMAGAAQPASGTGQRPVVGITNLGVLTRGTMRAMERLAAHGCETMVFHAVGSGGRAMEQLMRDGIIQAVFDYALGDISDALFGGIRAADENRLTVAGELGLPQVVVPGGTDHIGILLDEPNTVPDAYRDRKYTYHNPVILVPRTSAEELEALAGVLAERLAKTNGPALMLLPTGGVSSYSVAGGALEDRASDLRFFEALRQKMPVPVKEIAAGAEDQAFVDTAVDELVKLIGQKQGAA